MSLLASALGLRLSSDRVIMNRRNDELHVTLSRIDGVWHVVADDGDVDVTRSLWPLSQPGFLGE